MIAAVYGWSAQAAGNRWLKLGLVLTASALAMAACDDGGWERLAR